MYNVMCFVNCFVQFMRKATDVIKNYKIWYLWNYVSHFLLSPVCCSCVLNLLLARSTQYGNWEIQTVQAANLPCPRMDIRNFGTWFRLWRQCVYYRSIFFNKGFTLCIARSGQWMGRDWRNLWSENTFFEFILCVKQ